MGPTPFAWCVLPDPLLWFSSTVAASQAQQRFWTAKARSKRRLRRRLDQAFLVSLWAALNGHRSQLLVSVAMKKSPLVARSRSPLVAR